MCSSDHEERPKCPTTATMPFQLWVILTAFFGPWLLLLGWIFLSPTATRIWGEVEHVAVQCRVMRECNFFDADLPQLYNFFTQEDNSQSAFVSADGGPAICTFRAYVNLRYSAHLMLKNQRYLTPELITCQRKQ